MKFKEKNLKIVSSFILLSLLFNIIICNVSAIEYDPIAGEDDETNKEYTATLIDIQINTLMPLDGGSMEFADLGDEYIDDEYAGYADESLAEQEVSLMGSVQINKIKDNGEIEYLDKLPQVSLVDENDNIVATTDIFCASEYSSEPSDIYYIEFFDLDIQEGKTYKILATIEDNDNNIISKYITYNDESVISPGVNINMYYESINNILNIYFEKESDDEIIKGDLDGNGVVNANDAAYALDLYKYNNATDEDIQIGDIDGDGVINANDAALILDMYKYGK